MIKVKFQQSKIHALNKFLIDETGLERICYVLGYHYTDFYGNTIVIPDRVIMPTEDGVYATSTYVRLNRKISDYVYSQFLNSDYTVLVNCHSHPFDYTDRVSFSSIDDESNSNEYNYLFNKLKKQKNQDIIFLAYLCGNNSSTIRMVTGINQFDYNVSIRVIGQNYKYVKNSSYSMDKSINIISSEQFARHMEIFGGKTAEKILSEVKVAVVGCGGTGSIVVENLVRLGVKNIVLIDDDKVELTNLNRLQGVKINDVGKNKVDVIARNIKEYSNNLHVEAICQNIFSEVAYHYIKSVDVIFTCVDNSQARFFINRLAVSFLIPIFNVGVLVNKNESDEIECRWRADVFVPNFTNCMDCSMVEVYDKAITSISLHDPFTYNNMKKLGYIQDNPEIKNPSVYALNQQAVSQIMNEFHNYFVGFKKFVPHIRGVLAPQNIKEEKNVFNPATCGTCEIYSNTCNKYEQGFLSLIGLVKNGNI